MALFYNIIAYSWIFLGNGKIYVELHWNSKFWWCLSDPHKYVYIIVQEKQVRGNIFLGKQL